MPKRLPPGTRSIQSYRKSLDYKLDRTSYFIAMNGPSNKKTLERRLKIDKPTIYKAIHQLSDAKRITIHHREMSGMVKFYELTRLGVMHVVLFAFEESGEDAAKISDLVKKLFVRYPEWLPEIVRLWPAIQEISREERDETATTSLEALALYTLVSICENAVTHAVHPERHIRRDAPSLTLLLNWIYPKCDEDYGIRWLKAVRGNPVLREATKRKLLEKTQGLEDLIRALSN